MKARLWLAPLAAGGLLACGSPGASTSSDATTTSTASAAVTSPELNLKRVSDGKIAVELRSPADRKPRMVDVHVRWSQGWTLQGQTQGSATTRSQKMLIVKPVSDTEARVIVFSSSNTERLADGSLAELTLSGSGKGSAEIIPSPPMLAPAETEQGLHIGDPISL